MLRTVLAFVVGGLLTLSPTLAQPQALPADQLKKIKAATVFVKVKVGRLGGGTGSGFVVHATKDYGLVITNDHVTDPRLDELPGVPRGKPKVEVVFNSGLRDEWSGSAEVLYANKVDDLALLKVKAIKPIPEPLALTGADKLPETTPVYVCGFPFGEELAGGEKNPEISVGAASVSSNRTDADGEIATVQLNGALNPGNSGGPVVTQDGKLVGVAVRTVAGAGIGFAVPPRLVRRAVQDVHFSPAAATWVAGPPRKVRLESKFVDALGRMTTATAYVAPSTGNAFKARNADDVAKMADAKKVVPTVAAAAGLIVAEFEPPATPHYWVQFAWTDVDGQTHRARPEWLASEEAKPEPGAPPPPPVGITTELPNTPKGQIDVDELNRTVGKRTGERLTVDVLTLGSCDGFGNGPSLKGYNRHKQMPPDLDFALDAHLAEKLSFARFRGAYVAARVTGTVHGPAAGMSWDLFVVEEVKLLGPDGRVLEAHARKEKASLPRAIPRPEPPPTPKPPRVSTPPPAAGKAEIATELPDTPKGQIDVDELNRTSGRRIGERLTVDILTAGSSNGFGDGPSLTGYNRRREMPPALDFIVDAALAEKFPPGQRAARYMAVRLTGVVRRPTQARGWNLFVVEKVEVLGKDGSIVATYARKDPPADGPPKSVRTAPRSLPNEPYPLGSAEAQAKSYADFQAATPAALGKRYRYSVVFFASGGGEFEFQGLKVSAVTLSVRSPDTGLRMSNVQFLAPHPLYEQVWKELAKQPTHELPCVFEFHALTYQKATQQRVGTTDCLLTAISLADINDPQRRVELKAEWPPILTTALDLPTPPPTVPPPERPKAFVPEPYPLGSAAAQAESFAQLGVVNPAALGKRLEYSVLLAGPEPGSLLFGRTPVRSVRWSVLSPDTGQPLRNAAFYLPPGGSDQVLRAFRQLPKEARGLPCVLEFMAIHQDSRDGRGADRIDCVVTAVRYPNVAGRGGHHTLRADWDQPIRTVVVTGEVSPEQIDALLRDAAPTGDRPNDWLWPAVGTSVVAVLLAGGGRGGRSRPGSRGRGQRPPAGIATSGTTRAWTTGPPAARGERVRWASGGVPPRPSEARLTDHARVKNPRSRPRTIRSATVSRRPGLTTACTARRVDTRDLFRTAVDR